MGQRCVHYTERDNGTRVLYAPNQWNVDRRNNIFTVGYENHKPYLRTPYLNPYQNFVCLVGKKSKDSKL